MLKPLLASAMFAGLIAGLFASALELVYTVPLIAEAEQYESGALTHFANAEPGTGGHVHGTEAQAADGHGHGHDAAAGGSPLIPRDVKTVLMTILTTCGFGMFLVAGFAMVERFGKGPVDARGGILFGLAGFAATQLMPALGLSPEMPGAMAANLADRQLWWVATAVATAAGIAAIAYGNLAAGIGGAVLIAAPHIVGAPHPGEYGGVVPPELSALFAARVLGIWALIWAVLGALAGHFWSREAAG